MNFLLRHKWIVNSLAAYLVIWLMLVSLDGVVTFIKNERYDGLDYDYWHSYLSVEPVKNEYSYTEIIKFESTILRNRPTGISWNDILFCDLDGDGMFNYFTNYESLTKERPLDPEQVGATSTHEWVYGDRNTRKVPKGATCFLESQITYTPTELADTKQPTRRQTIRSTNTFTIKE